MCLSYYFYRFWRKTPQNQSKLASTRCGCQVTCTDEAIFESMSSQCCQLVGQALIIWLYSLLPACWKRQRAITYLFFLVNRVHVALSIGILQQMAQVLVEGAELFSEWVTALPNSNWETTYSLTVSLPVCLYIDMIHTCTYTQNIASILCFSYESTHEKQQKLLFLC